MLLTMMPYFSYLSADHAMSSKAVQDFTRQKDLHFDLIIHFEVFHNSFLIFGHLFKAPVVSICKFVYDFSSLLLFEKAY